MNSLPQLVYVLRYDYNGDFSVVGVYSSREKAIAAQKEYCLDAPDDWDDEAFELDEVILDD
jgi:hypothetical protein